MAEITVYEKPTCGTCRRTVELLEGSGVELERVNYYDERFDRGFEYAFVVPGMTRVVQAAGRLIRGDTDTGVIALFDKRFLFKTYRQYLPSHWLDDGNARELAGDPEDVARRFFADAAIGMEAFGIKT